MSKYGENSSILITVILGFILSVIGIWGLGGIFTIIFLGFLATYLTGPEKGSLWTGGKAMAILAIIISFFTIITPPDLGYQLSSLLSIDPLTPITGIVTLAQGFFLAIGIYFALGMLGGYIAEQFFLEKKPTSKRQPPRKRRPTPNNEDMYN